MDEFFPYLMAALVIAADIGIYLVMQRKLEQYRKLVGPDASRATATIEKKKKESHDNGVSYKVHYRFKAWDSKEWQGKCSIPEEAWETLNEGDSIAVAYVRENPKINTVSEYMRDNLAMYEKLMKFLPYALIAPLIIAAVFLKWVAW